MVPPSSQDVALCRYSVAGGLSGACVPYRTAAMALVTLQRSPTPSATSSSASNSEVSPGPAALARPSSRSARPGPRVQGAGRRGLRRDSFEGSSGLRAPRWTTPSRVAGLG